MNCWVLLILLFCNLAFCQSSSVLVINKPDDISEDTLISNFVYPTDSVSFEFSFLSSLEDNLLVLQNYDSVILVLGQESLAPDFDVTINSLLSFVRNDGTLIIIGNLCDNNWASVLLEGNAEICGTDSPTTLQTGNSNCAYALNGVIDFSDFQAGVYPYVFNPSDGEKNCIRTINECIGAGETSKVASRIINSGSVTFIGGSVASFYHGLNKRVLNNLLYSKFEFVLPSFSAGFDSVNDLNFMKYFDTGLFPLKYQSVDLLSPPADADILVITQRSMVDSNELKTSLYNFARNGRKVLAMGNEFLNSDMTEILGGSSFVRNLPVQGRVSAYPNYPQCSLLLRGYNELTFNDPNIDIMEFANADVLFTNEGDAIPCLTFNGQNSFLALASVLPMGSGSIVWMSTTDNPSFITFGYPRKMLDNLISAKEILSVNVQEREVSCDIFDQLDLNLFVPIPEGTSTGQFLIGPPVAVVNSCSSPTFEIFGDNSGTFSLPAAYYTYTTRTASEDIIINLCDSPFATDIIIFNCNDCLIIDVDFVFVDICTTSDNHVATRIINPGSVGSVIYFAVTIESGNSNLEFTVTVEEGTTCNLLIDENLFQEITQGTTASTLNQISLTDALGVLPRDICNVRSSFTSSSSSPASYYVYRTQSDFYPIFFDTCNSNIDVDVVFFGCDSCTYFDETEEQRCSFDFIGSIPNPGSIGYPIYFAISNYGGSGGSFELTVTEIPTNFIGFPLCEPQEPVGSGVLVFLDGPFSSYSLDVITALDQLGITYTMVDSRPLTQSDFEGIGVLIDTSINIPDCPPAFQTSIPLIQNFIERGGSIYIQIELANTLQCNQQKIDSLITPYLSFTAPSPGPTYAGICSVSSSLPQEKECSLTTPNDIRGTSISCNGANNFQPPTSMNDALVIGGQNEVLGLIYAGSDIIIPGSRMVVNSDVNADFAGSDFAYFHNVMEFLLNGC